jgi:F0F1-type ATP synthase membrane subunit c/vacuolar-type H+-ATPase subunit K
MGVIVGHCVGGGLIMGVIVGHCVGGIYVDPPPQAQQFSVGGPMDPWLN